MASPNKDFHWAQQACQQFRNFKKIGDYKLNFSCPICGDSKKDDKAARCYVYLSPKRILKVKCHNCGYGAVPFGSFLKLINPQMHKQYLLSVFDDRNTELAKEEKPLPKMSQESLNRFNAIVDDDLLQASSVEISRHYLLSRRIPEKAWNRIFYHENYTKWAVKKFNRKMEKLPYSDKRAVLLCKNEKGDMIGTIGRTLTDSNLRYNNIKINDDYPNLVYGLDNINSNTPIRVVEGAFDSLFVDNAIAMSSSALATAVRYAPKENLVLIWDREYRSQEIVNQLAKAIHDGFKVVIFPSYLQSKDINDMVLNDGIEDINSLIDKHTYSGLLARLKLAEVSKI